MQIEPTVTGRCSTGSSSRIGHRIRRLPVRAVLAACIALACTIVALPAHAAPDRPVYVYPPAPPGTVTDTYFGTQVADPYRWLESSPSPAASAWIDAEATLTRRYLDSLPSLPRRTSQVDALLDTPVWNAPSIRQGRMFWTEQPVDADHPLLMWSQGGARPTVLVDPSRLKGSGPVSIAEWEPSPDGQYVAWTASESGSDWRTIRVVRVSDGVTMPEVIPNARFTDVWWTNDSTAFAYQAYPVPADGATAAAYAQLRYHVLGSPVSDDVVLVDNPADPAERYWIYEDEARGRVLIAIGLREWSYRWLDELRPGSIATPLFTVPSALAPAVVTIVGRQVWMRESQQAPTGRIVRVDVDAPAPDQWITVVPAQSDTLSSASAVGDRLVLTYLHQAASRMRLTDLAGRSGARVRLPGIGTTGTVVGSPGRSTAYFTYSSFAQPSQVLSLDARTGAVTTWRAPQTPFDPTDFVTTSAMIPSADGTPVHAFIVRRTDVTRTGANPTLLYGYGGFNIPLTPEYRPEWLAWVQSGGVLVYANLRGGGEFGRDWYSAGTRLTKQRTFDDFIAIAEWLKARRWTDTAHLAISGRSNGGLLVGAVMTQRPDLAAVAIPQVGVLDMLRYHQFTIGASWARDYGRSDESAEMFHALHAYSPVHNVRPGVRYPATLVTTAESDDRVVPAHSYKFAAALQADNAGTKPVLIRIERGAGHGAGASRDQVISQIADRLAFLDANLGTAPVIPAPVFRRAP